MYAHGRQQEGVVSLTVLPVDTSSRYFVHDHVFRTARKAALHTVTSGQHFQHLGWPCEVYMNAVVEPSALLRQELTAGGIWITACVNTGACTGLVAPLTHHAIWDYERALCKEKNSISLNFYLLNIPKNHMDTAVTCLTTEPVGGFMKN